MLSVEFGEKQENRPEVFQTQDKKHYRLHLWYNRRDETDLLIRILSFDPMIRVTEPKELVDQIWVWLRQQRRYSI